MDEMRMCTAEGKKLVTKKYMLCDSIYVSFKNTKVRTVISLRKKE